MCIALLTTAHPHYKLILLNNRDEYLNRPTSPAQFWPDYPSILSGRDLLRPTRGTWLGITRTGRIACLTNFREDTPTPSAVSRGQIIKDFLTLESDGEDVAVWAEGVVDTGVARDAGGFTLIAGQLDDDQGLVVVSNRAERGKGLPRICGDVVMTVGVSNGPFQPDGVEKRWEKVTRGESKLLEVVQHDVQRDRSRDENEFVTALLAVLSEDTLDRKGRLDHEGLEVHINELRNTILVPPLGRRQPMRDDQIAASTSSEKAVVVEDDQLLKQVKQDDVAKHSEMQLGVSGIYATQKQTVILVGYDKRVRFFERTLFDDNSRPVETGKGDVDVTLEYGS